LRQLEALGYGEKIEVFRNIHGKTLSTILGKLPDQTIDSLINQELISGFPQPKVTIK
jgi:hypothetical protein